uniref:Uncharacterized protein n=1 Tax=Arundo donax TaxID=35708 RepID=A0A0A8Z0S5_ARUDO
MDVNVNSDAYQVAFD